jgi:hypothetical protein
VADACRRAGIVEVGRVAGEIWCMSGQPWERRWSTRRAVPLMTSSTRLPGAPTLRMRREAMRRTLRGRRKYSDRTQSDRKKVPNYNRQSPKTNGFVIIYIALWANYLDRPVGDARFHALQGSQWKVARLMVTFAYLGAICSLMTSPSPSPAHKPLKVRQIDLSTIQIALHLGDAAIRILILIPSAQASESLTDRPLVQPIRSSSWRCLRILTCHSSFFSSSPSHARFGSRRSLGRRCCRRRRM